MATRFRSGSLAFFIEMFTLAAMQSRLSRVCPCSAKVAENGGIVGEIGVLKIVQITPLRDNCAI